MLKHARQHPRSEAAARKAKHLDPVARFVESHKEKICRLDMGQKQVSRRGVKAGVCRLPVCVKARVGRNVGAANKQRADARLVVADVGAVEEAEKKKHVSGGARAETGGGAVEANDNVLHARAGIRGFAAIAQKRGGRCCNSS